MKQVLLAVLALAVTTACSERASEPTAVQTEALIASSAEWTPADFTRDLPVDDATRERIETGVRTLHAAMLDLYARHEKAETLEGDARSAFMMELEADVRALHEQHVALWNSLDADVREALAARFHAQMDDHHGGPMKSLHDRLRSTHGGDH